MWSKRAPLLYLRLSHRGVRPRLQIWLFLALYVPHQLLLACEGLLALLPGEFGMWARRAVDTVHGLLLELMSAQPQSIADINIEHGLRRLRVRLRTCGLFSGGDEA